MKIYLPLLIFIFCRVNLARAQYYDRNVGTIQHYEGPAKLTFDNSSTYSTRPLKTILSTYSPPSTSSSYSTQSSGAGTYTAPIDYTNFSNHYQPGKFEHGWHLFDDGWGFIDKAGKLGAPIFDQIKDDRDIDIPKGYTLGIIQGRNGERKLGLYDSDFNTIIPPSYEDIIPSGDLFITQQSHSYIFFNKSGKKITGKTYDSVATAGDCYIIGISGKFGLINSMAKEILPVKYDYIEGTENGFIVRDATGYNVFDHTGKETISKKYPSLAPGIDGFIFKTAEKSGMLSPDGKELTPAIYDNIEPSYPLLIVSRGHYKGFLNKNGTELVAAKFTGAFRFSREFFLVYESAEKFGILNTEGIEICPPKYSDIKQISLWDLTGPREKYDPAIFDLYECTIRKDNEFKTGLLDKSGREIVPPAFNYFTPYAKSLIETHTEGKTGLVDKTGKELFPPTKGLMLLDSDVPGLFELYVGNKYGLINEAGKIIVEPKYDLVGASGYKGYIVVTNKRGKKNFSYGLVDETGKTIVEPIFDSQIEMYKTVSGLGIQLVWR